MNAPWILLLPNLGMGASVIAEPDIEGVRVGFLQTSVRISDGQVLRLRVRKVSGTATVRVLPGGTNILISGPIGI